MITVRPAIPDDAEDWLRMRCALWPEGSTEEHSEEIERFLSGNAVEPQAVLIAISEKEAPFGFAELSIRSCAEGCFTGRVAYLEGWFVDERVRRRGVGRALVEAAEAWGRRQGCTEFASDTEVGNDTSAAAHKALGFEDVGLVRCFRKEL